MSVDSPDNTDSSDIEAQAYARMQATFGRVIRSVDRVLDRRIFFVTKIGQVYKEKQYDWEKTKKIDFHGEKKKLVFVGSIDPEDIRKQIRRFVHGQIGDVSPYTVKTEIGEAWDDFIIGL